MPANIDTQLAPLLTEPTTLSHFSAARRVLNLALPMALSYTFSIEMWLMVLFLSRLNADKKDTASITLITTMINALVVIGISPLFAMSIIAGKKSGELKNAQDRNEDEGIQEELKDDIARVNHHGLIIAAAMTPFVMLPLIFSDSILTNVFKQNPDVAARTQVITRPYGLIAVPPIMLRLCSEQMMFSFGKTKPAMIMGLCNAAIGMWVAYSLAFGKFDAPKMGEKGMLIGYSLEAGLTSGAFSLYIALHPDFKDFAFFRPKNILSHLNKIKSLLNIGVPILIGNAIEMGAIVATGALAGRVGIAEQAAYSTTMQFVLFAFLLQSAFGQSTSQEISRLIGDNAYQSAATIGRSGILTAVACAIPMPLLFSIKPEFLIKLLGQDTPGTQDILTHLAPIMFVCVLFDTLRYNLLKPLQNNLDDGKVSTAIASIGLSGGVLLSWGLGLKTSLGIYGVALGYMISLIATTACLFTRWYPRIKPEAIEAQQITTTERNRFFQYGAIDEEDNDHDQHISIPPSFNEV